MRAFVAGGSSDFYNLYPPPHAKAAALITIDSHQDGQTLQPGVAELFGTYSGVYELQLIVNGEFVTDVQMDDPNGDDSGSWSYKLDTSQLTVQSKWSLKQTMRLRVMVSGPLDSPKCR